MSKRSNSHFILKLRNIIISNNALGNQRRQNIYNKTFEHSSSFFHWFCIITTIHAFLMYFSIQSHVCWITSNSIVEIYLTLWSALNVPSWWIYSESDFPIFTTLLAVWESFNTVCNYIVYLLIAAWILKLALSLTLRHYALSKYFSGSFGSHPFETAI